jgi:isopenicillin N synthase-like dioxygenase
LKFPSCDFFLRGNPGSKAIEDYFGALRDLGLKMAGIILNSLGIYPHKYDGFVPKEPALMRFNHYPPCPDPSQAVGLVAHSDANLFTILHQGEVAGLQVLNDDRWVAVRPHPQAFAINVGDMLKVFCFSPYYDYASYLKDLN